MTTQEIIKMLISIRKDADRLHSGNVAHQRTHIIGDLQWLIDELSKANDAKKSDSNCNIPLVSNRRELLIGYQKSLGLEKYRNNQGLANYDIDQYLANL